ncbi:MAG: HTTM domain-containing protein [Gemmatimonadetes bacterium]|nr:HTTM domain-containing protein [Gemmatimonadota bacterium]
MVRFSYADFKTSLFTAIPADSLIAFRIAFGLVMFGDAVFLLSRGYVDGYYTNPEFFFTYPGFGWVSPWPGNGMTVHFYLLAALALCIAVGLMYRVSATLFFLGFAYVFLLDQAAYQNHNYLILLISFIMIFVPAHRGYSVDAYYNTHLSTNTAPAWTLWLLRFQIGVVYVYGGIAKISGDWLHGEPLLRFLPGQTDFPIVGRFFSRPEAAYTLSYGGLLFDLFLVPLLLWRRTRIAAFAAAVLFHLFNHTLFDIGIFPWLMIPATLLFFSPTWPRAIPRWSPGRGTSEVLPDQAFGTRPRRRKVVLAALGAYCAIQLLVPLRHHLYPGDVNWTEEGHIFSWRMKLRNKSAGGVFLVRDPQNDIEWQADARRYLMPHQIQRMFSRPDMIRQFAEHLSETIETDSGNLEVRARISASLHGRPTQPLVDPTVDLAKVGFSLALAPWIVPLQYPLMRFADLPR